LIVQGSDKVHIVNGARNIRLQRGGCSGKLIGHL